MPPESQESHDLLIRIATKQELMETAVNSRLGKIEALLAQRLCFTHAEKLRTHDRFIWGCFGASLAALTKAFWTT